MAATCKEPKRKHELTALVHTHKRASCTVHLMIVSQSAETLLPAESVFAVVLIPWNGCSTYLFDTHTKPDHTCKICKDLLLSRPLPLCCLDHLDHNLYKMLSSVPVIERFIYIKMTSPDQHFIVISLYSEVRSYNRAFDRCFPFATIVNKISVL